MRHYLIYMIFKPTIFTSFLMLSAFLFYMELIHQYSTIPHKCIKIQPHH